MSTASSDMDVQTGLIGGAITWIVGLVVAFVLAALGVVTGPMGMDLSQDIDLVLSVFAEWHLFSLVLGDQLVTGVVWALVPIVILIVSGFLVADRTGGGPMEGASITVGYLILAVLSVVYFMVQMSPDVVDMLVYLIVGGVVFPVIFGAIGGFIAQEV